jgi:hypothetical protein
LVEDADNVAPPADLDFSNLAANLTAGSAQHAAEIRSFEQAYDAELRGVVDASGDSIMEIVCKMAEDAGTSPPPRGSDRWLESQRLWKSAIYQAVKKETGKQNLRSMHVGASLHAVFRWDKGRKFTGNEIYDFQHAAAALAHCKAFFTDHPLQTTIVTNRKVALDQRYNCHVVSNVRDALAYLGALEAKQAASQTSAGEQA